MTDKAMERPLRLRGIRTPDMNDSPELPDVYSAAEIARVAGVRRRDVLDLIALGAITPLDGTFFPAGDAILAVRTLQGQAPVTERPLFRGGSAVRREPAMPLAVS